MNTLAEAAHSTVIVEAAAQACHEVNRAYCLALGDYSQLPWETAPSWQKASAVDGVKGALGGNTPEQQHDQWCADKVREGWVHGPVKDAEKKTHPCLLPYSQLPPEQKAKDHLFVTTARAVAGALLLNEKRRKSGTIPVPTAEQVQAALDKNKG